MNFYTVNGEAILFGNALEWIINYDKCSFVILKVQN